MSILEKYFHHGMSTLVVYDRPTLTWEIEERSIRDFKRRWKRDYNNCVMEFILRAFSFTFSF